MAKILNTPKASSNPSKALSPANVRAVFGTPKKDDGSIRNARGMPTGKMSSGAGWGGEAPSAGAYQSKK